MAGGHHDDERPLLTDLDELLAAHGDHTYREFLRVPAREPHRFVDISQDLRVLVLFAPPDDVRT